MTDNSFFNLVKAQEAEFRRRHEQRALQMSSFLKKLEQKHQIQEAVWSLVVDTQKPDESLSNHTTTTTTTSAVMKSSRLSAIDTNLTKIDTTSKKNTRFNEEVTVFRPRGVVEQGKEGILSSTQETTAAALQPQSSSQYHPSSINNSASSNTLISETLNQSSDLQLLPAGSPKKSALKKIRIATPNRLVKITKPLLNIVDGQVIRSPRDRELTERKIHEEVSKDGGVND